MVPVAKPGLGFQRFLRTLGMQLGFLAWLVSVLWKLGTTFVCVSVRIPSKIWVFGKVFFSQQAGVAVVIYEPVFS